MAVLRSRVLYVAGLALAANLVASSALALPAATGERFRVRIRNLASASNEEILRGRFIAEEIFRDAGVADVEWVVCGLSNAFSQDALCPDPLAPNEVVVRVVDTPPRWPNPETLGFSYIERNTGFGWLSTVFADRIDDVARRSQMSPATLLGRTMAHEVGHLLLRTTTHSEEGLMRERWTSAELRRNLAQDWTFASRDAAQVRREVHARANWLTDLILA